MSYPGSMSRGKKPVVRGKTKAWVEGYFATEFSLQELWASVDDVAKAYDGWHKAQTLKLGRYLESQDCLGDPEKSSAAVAAKFLNTFMHQIMKYPEMQPLWAYLHLPLDSRIFGAFKSSSSPILEEIVGRQGSRSAYELSYAEYLEVQNRLMDYIGELNERPGAHFVVRSRIELNLLWL
jgi:hypothetical protein